MKRTHLVSIALGLGAATVMISADAQTNRMNNIVAAPMMAAQNTREINAPPVIKAKLESFRAAIRQNNLRYTVGYTKVMDQPRHALLGDQDDPKMTRAVRMSVTTNALNTLKADEDARVKFLLANPDMRRTLPDITIVKLMCNANLSAWDWRTRGKVTPVRHQTCGNCWAFAATAAYESAQLMRNNATTDEAEQYINDCATTDDGADAGSCSGGLATNALQHMVRVGDATEAAVPYTGTNNMCTSPAANMKSIAWGYVDPAVDFPTRAQIKQALCANGALTTRMRVVSDAIFSYTGGVYNEPVASDSDGGGHAVAIVGWDDAKGAWLIKNSWDTDWGEGGYGWIGYNSNRIGRHTAWVKARSNFYAFNPALIKNFQLQPVRP
jgi:C1A family cysteine protease